MFLTHVSDGLSTVGVENMCAHFCTLAHIQHTVTHAHVRTHAQGHTNKHTHTRARAQDIQTCSERSAPTINVGTLAAAESRKKQQKQQ